MTGRVQAVSVRPRDGGYVLGNISVELPWSVSPRVETLPEPVPMIVSNPKDYPIVLHVHGQGASALQSLYHVFREIAIQPAEGNHVPTASLRSVFADWVAAYTAWSRPPDEAVKSVIYHQTVTRRGEEYYAGIDINQHTWISGVCHQ